MFRPRPPAVTALLLVLCGAFVYGQTTAAAQPPFVSLLRATASGSEIKLTWKDPANLAGKILVYRHTEEISEATIAGAELVASVPMGTQTYSDAPSKAGEYFYAALVEDAAKKRYDYFIPFRNITGMAISTAPSTAPVAAAAPAAQAPAAIAPSAAPAASPTPQTTALTAAPSGITPFISRLKASASGYQISLTWKDSTEVKGENLIFRYTEEISESTIGSAVLLARVQPGVEKFVDTPPDQKGYFYAVLIEDAAKKRYSVFIPFRNITGSAVAIETTAPEDKLATIITGIKAAVSPTGDVVVLSFNSSNPARDLLVFWGTAPFAVAEDLLRGTSKTNIDPGVTACNISAIPGVNYYFAVLDAGYYKIGQVPLEAGQNTTTTPVQIPLSSSLAELPIAPERRTLPLPALQLTQAVETGRDLPAEESYIPTESQAVSTATEDAIEKILAAVPSATKAEPKPVILASDSAASTGGELASLSAVIKNQFAAGRYEEAGKLIQDFLSIRRKPDIEARAHFYLGQIKFFGKDTRGAVLEFLLAEEYFYAETRKWLDACFVRLESSAGGT